MLIGKAAAEKLAALSTQPLRKKAPDSARFSSEDDKGKEKETEGHGELLRQSSKMDVR